MTMQQIIENTHLIITLDIPFSFSLVGYKPFKENTPILTFQYTNAEDLYRNRANFISKYNQYKKSIN